MLSKLVFVTSLTLSLVSASVCYAKPKEKAKSYHTCTKNDTTEKVLACTGYFEMRSGGKEGMDLVINTVLNRKNSEDFPDTTKKVIYQKNQFSYLKGPKQVTEYDSWKKAKEVATVLYFMEKNFPKVRKYFDKTNGAVYFKKCSVKTRWEKGKQKTLVYHGHCYFK